MNSTTIKFIGYSLIAVSFSAEMLIVSPGIWFLIPYIVMGIVLSIHMRVREIVIDLITISLIFAGSLYMVTDIYYHPDPQAGIAIAILPFLQVAAYTFLSLSIRMGVWMYYKE